MSRTLGFVAGLTVPAGIYYISALHLRGTAGHLSESLHEQSVRLENPTKLQPVVFEPRQHDHFVARVRQGWNEGIENGVRFIQDTDWPDFAKQTGVAISNLSNVGWEKLQPTIEEGKAKMHEASESTRDAALHAGESVGRTMHDANIKTREFAHEANVQAHTLARETSAKSQELARDAEAEAHRLAKLTKSEAVEAQQYLQRAQRQATSEYEIMKAKSVQTGQEVKHETQRQAEEAQSILSRIGSAFASKTAEKGQELKEETTRQAREAEAALSEASSMIADKTAQKAASLKEEGVRQANEAQSVLSRVGSALSSKTAQKSQELKDETTRQAREAEAAISDASSMVADKSARKGQEIKEEGARQAQEAQSILSRIASALSSKTAQKSQELKQETLHQTHEAETLLAKAKSAISSKVDDIRDSATVASDKAKAHIIDAKDQTAQKAESSLLAAQMKASEAWVLAEERYQRLLESTEHQADLKHKELLEHFGARRIGFTSVNDPTNAEAQVRKAEAHKKKQEAEEQAFKNVEITS